MRTWSLIVTIFGDMARAPGSQITGPVLSRLTARIGIKPEAMRVALHRLRKDGWIASRRAGRVSQYFLTETGRRECEQATARIFARETPTPDTWHLILSEPGNTSARLALDQSMQAAGSVVLAPGAWLGAGPVPPGLAKGLFALDGTAPRLPDWLRDTVMPTSLVTAYAEFDATLSEVSTLLAGQFDRLTPLDRAAIRVLLVHGWRRLVLRHADLPDGFFPPCWRGVEARAKLHSLLDRLAQISLADLAAHTPA